MPTCLLPVVHSNDHCSFFLFGSPSQITKPAREFGSPADKAQGRIGESNTCAQYPKQTQAWPKHLSGFPNTQIWN
jgi:hypothetical protein